jgi:hypothetical protein
VAILNLKRDEVAALVRELKHAPKSEPIVSVRRKLDDLQQPAQPLAGQMDVYDCIKESQ